MQELINPYENIRLTNRVVTKLYSDNIKILLNDYVNARNDNILKSEIANQIILMRNK